MAIRLRDALMGQLDALRYEPTDKRIRGVLGDETLVDSSRAVLVWEPGRVVPTYAVPVEDVQADVLPAPAADAPDPTTVGVPAMGAPMLGDRLVLDPSVPFEVRTTPGERHRVRGRASGGEVLAFVAQDEALDGFVIVDFDGFDAWYEEDERNVGHPRDPFHRIDILRSSRRVRIELAGRTLADSVRPYLLFEPPLPVRYYLPRDDVRTDLLRPSPTSSCCAYKGQASYWSCDDASDIAWSYPQPLREASEVRGLVAFFDERVDVIVDGALLERPVTPWSPPQSIADQT